MIRTVLVASFLILASGFPQGPRDEDAAGKCGYDSCPATKPGKINVHIVPHTHDDVGWLKTVDQYYFGSRTNIQNAGVQYIIDSVVNELVHDPKKKFIYVETAFFWKWFTEQDDSMKHEVQRLVKNGQLEFIGGAWSMNDEATTHYQSVIDQFTWGFRKLNDTFGYCGQPKIGWQIDPFGHSRETASMMAQFGFDGLFFGRLDYQDKNRRLETQTMEMIWEGSPALGSAGDLLTGALYNHYSAPPGFCFDVLCEDEPFVTDPNSPDFNVIAKVNFFISFVKKQTSRFFTNNIMLTMGDDFNYQDAHMYFKNLDILISPVFHTLGITGHDLHITNRLTVVHPQTATHPSTKRANRFATGPTADIFTGALYNLYQAPRGFCFDIMCGDEPIIDDINSPDYNVNNRVKKFLDFIEWQNAYYRNNEIMLTMGGDFNYQDAHYYFKNLDKLIRYVNKLQKTGSNVNVFYSTPSCYVKSLNDANMTWPTKQDDFFPYASDPHAYWTGYFTSRPTQKYFERQGNNYLQICKQLSSLSLLGHENNPKISALREAMGVMQHHDAITGTEKQHVANDYARILTEGFKKCENASAASLNKLMATSPSVPPLDFKSCLLTNISECSISANAEKFAVTVYNPLSRPTNYIVRLPVYRRSYSVKNPEGGEILSQIVPIPLPLVNLPGRHTRTLLELVFRAEAIPPLGYRSYFVTALNTTQADPEEEVFDDLEEISIGNEKTQLTVNTTTGLLSSAVFNGHKINFYQTLEYYIGRMGSNDKFENRASGAYIFRPKDNYSVTIAPKVNVTAYKGPIVTEFHQTFSNWASQVTRQYSKESHIEIEWMVGPIPIDDLQGKEIISKFVTDLNNKGVFYTDSNGRQTIERRRNFRPTWNLNLREPIAGNYYPITTDISINNGELEMTVFTDRAQGGSSIKDGEIELMLHRRLLYDDGFGVGEALNEEAYGEGLIARGRHWIQAGNLTDPNWQKQKRLLQQEKVLSPQIVLTDATNLDFAKWSKSYKLTYSGLTQALPPEVQILTLEPWKGKSHLLRLEHLLDKIESGKEVTVNLNNLFAAFDIFNIRETSLGADRWLNEVSRLKWRKETNEILDNNESTPSLEASFPQVTLKPKQIRTFVFEIKPKKAI